jgi:hypothetical protein
LCILGSRKSTRSCGQGGQFTRTDCCGLSCRGLIGPICFEGTVTDPVYLSILWASILPASRQLCGNEPFYFQQTGAPLHYHRNIRSYLDETLRSQWIGWRGSIEYHPCSPYLTPLDFYLWGSLKDVVYCRKRPTLEMLREEAETACASIPVDTLATDAHALVLWTQKCLQANGGHFEHLF